MFGSTLLGDASDALGLPPFGLLAQPTSTKNKSDNATFSFTPQPLDELPKKKRPEI
jgi:hypothetical protein